MAVAEWRHMVLAGLGAPASGSNLTALALWAQSEGTPAGWHNWLATTKSGFGGHAVNSAGVKAYPTTTAGAEATVATLRLSYYTGVVAALRGDEGYRAIWGAVNGSPWCRGCQGGHYPAALYPLAVNPGQSPVGPVAGGAAGPVANAGAESGDDYSGTVGQFRSRWATAATGFAGLDTAWQSLTRRR